MNNSKFSDFKDEMGEHLEDLTRVVKKQIVAKPQQSDASNTSDVSDKSDKKVDPTTGKPVPSKKMLTQLNQQVVQLAQMRLKKVREELEKQRLKTDSTKPTGEAGPEIKPEAKKPQDDAVQKALQSSKSTGEFKGAIGG